jgi:hypothetical protein
MTCMSSDEVDAARKPRDLIVALLTALDGLSPLSADRLVNAR